MSGHERNNELREAYSIGRSWWFSDPGCVLYGALKLRRGTFMQLFGPKVFLNGAMALLRGHGVDKLEGDGFQMPGAFVLEGDRVLRSFEYEHAASSADFEALACEAPA